MRSQGYALYARRESDNTWWIVVGWHVDWKEEDEGVAGWTPVMVPADRHVERALPMAQDRFWFATIPTELEPDAPDIDDLVRMAEQIVRDHEGPERK